MSHSPDSGRGPFRYFLASLLGVLLGGLTLTSQTLGQLANSDEVSDKGLTVLVEESTIFQTLDGTPTIVPAGEYVISVERVEFKLTAENGSSEHTIAAVAGHHDESLNHDIAVYLLTVDSDERRLLVLDQDGGLIEAQGQKSPVVARNVLRMQAGPRVVAERQRYVTTAMNKPNYAVASASLNRARLASYYDKPDLVISSCTFSPLYTAGWWNYSVVLKNIGSQPVTFEDRASLIKYDSHPSGGGYSTVAAPNGGLYLAPNAEWTKSTSITFEEGLTTLPFEADPYNRVYERRETNNVCVAAVPQTHPADNQPPPSKPDLIVPSITVQPASGPPGTTFTITAQARNIGTQVSPTGNGQEAAIIRCEPGGVKSLGSINIGATKSYQFAVDYPMAPGQKSVECYADWPNWHSRIDESDESNNGRTVTFTVTQP